MPLFETNKQKLTHDCFVPCSLWSVARPVPQAPPIFRFVYFKMLIFSKCSAFAALHYSLHNPMWKLLTPCEMYVMFFRKLWKSYRERKKETDRRIMDSVGEKCTSVFGALASWHPPAVNQIRLKRLQLGFWSRAEEPGVINVLCACATPNILQLMTEIFIVAEVKY